MSNENYETQDLCLAAVLQYFGSPIRGVEHGTDGRATFFFEHNRRCEQVKEAFWLYQLQIEPRAFFNALKATKARLYEGRD